MTSLAPRPKLRPIDRFHRSVLRLGFAVGHRSTLLGRRYRELERTQWLSRDELLDLQWRKLQRLVAHAYARVPFYRRRMEDAGLTPATIQSPDDYRRLPVLTKADLRLHREELVAEGTSRNELILTGSGGSTGKPVSLYHDASQIAAMKAAKLRNFRWAGWEPGDAWARIWGNNFDVAPHEQFWGRVAEHLTRIRWLTSFRMTEASMSDYAAELQKFKPDVIEAYVNPLYLFARFLRLNDRVGTIRPRGIIVSAETLHDYQREEIEFVFGCPVFNRYGCREVGDVAQECPAGRNHLNVENVYAEFVRDGQPTAAGEPGEVILTALDLYGMPLLRYQVEDVGAWSDERCPCGRGLPLLSAVHGRVQDLIVTRSGQHLTGVFFAHLLKEMDVEQFQVIQSTLDALDFLIVPGPTFREEHATYIRQTAGNYLGPDIEVRLRCVESIPDSPSGKHRVTISLVEPHLRKIGGHQYAR